jgi:hypothetical protein
MSSSRRNQTTVNSKDTAESIRRSKPFQTFFAKAIRHLDDFATEKEWARQSTLTFRKEAKVSARFVTVYFAFLNEAEKHQEGYESESVGDDNNSVSSNDTYERDGFVVNDDECESIQEEDEEEEWQGDHDSCESESIASEPEADDNESKRNTRIVRPQSNVFTNNGEQTQAEENYGQQMLHKIIIKEYNAWYEAFEKEAMEDTEEDAMTADERFQWHCAKVLARKTDIRAKEIYPVVGAWLQEHSNA